VLHVTWNEWRHRHSNVPCLQESLSYQIRSSYSVSSAYRRMDEDWMEGLKIRSKDINEENDKCVACRVMASSSRSYSKLINSSITRDSGQGIWKTYNDIAKIKSVETDNATDPKSKTKNIDMVRPAGCLQVQQCFIISKDRVC
jgi:DNA replication protein DnaD